MLNTYGQRMLDSISGLMISNCEDLSDLYAEFYAISREIGNLRLLFAQIYADMFVGSASLEAVTRYESQIGGTRSELTLEQRKNCLKNRRKLKHICLKPSAVTEIMNALNCTASCYTGSQSDDVVISVEAYYPEESCVFLEKQLLGLFPAGYKISFEYG